MGEDFSANCPLTKPPNDSATSMDGAAANVLLNAPKIMDPLLLEKRAIPPEINIATHGHAIIRFTLRSPVSRIKTSIATTKIKARLGYNNETIHV